MALSKSEIYRERKSIHTEQTKGVRDLLAENLLTSTKELRQQIGDPLFLPNSNQTDYRINRGTSTDIVIRADVAVVRIKKVRRGLIIHDAHDPTSATISEVMLAEPEQNSWLYDYEWQMAQLVAQMQVRGALSHVIKPKAFIRPSSNSANYRAIAYELVADVNGVASTLFDTLKRNLIDKLEYYLQAGNTILEMHAQGLGHGDISISQVFIGDTKALHPLSYAVVGDLGSILPLSEPLFVHHRRDAPTSTKYFPGVFWRGQDQSVACQKYYYDFANWAAKQQATDSQNVDLAPVKDTGRKYPISPTEFLAIENVAFVRGLIELLSYTPVSFENWEEPIPNYEDLIRMGTALSTRWTGFKLAHPKVAIATQSLFKQVWSAACDFLKSTDHNDAALSALMTELAGFHRQMLSTSLTLKPTV